MNTPDLSIEKNCEAWINLFTSLSRQLPDITDLEEITSRDVRFCDPFNDLTGRQQILDLLRHTRETVGELEFRVLNRTRSGTQVFLRWEMSGLIPVLGAWNVQGMSELQFNDEGQLLMHQDYWDASEQFYARLPVIGWLLRRIRQRASVSQRKGSQNR